MKLRLRRISPSSLAATLAIFYFVCGLFVGVFGIFAALIGSQFTVSGPIQFSGSGIGMLLLAIVYPFLAAIGGAISGFIIAWIYNFISIFTNGLLVEFDEAGRRDR